MWACVFPRPEEDLRLVRIPCCRAEPAHSVPADTSARTKKNFKPQGLAAIAVGRRKPKQPIDESEPPSEADASGDGAAATGTRSMKPAAQAAYATAGSAQQNSSADSGDANAAATANARSIKPAAQAAYATAGRSKAPLDPWNDPADGAEPPPPPKPPRPPLPKAGVRLVHNITIDPVPPQPETPFSWYRAAHGKYLDAINAAAPANARSIKPAAQAAYATAGRSKS